jgi:hypothetical protein
MLRSAAAFLLSLLLPSTAITDQVDMSTGRVVIASATCVNQTDAFLM